MPGCGASGVGRSPTPDRPSLKRAAGARYTLACGCGGGRAWGPVINATARALASCLCALWVRHGGARGGGRLLPGCGASGVRRSPTPDRPPLGLSAGARFPLAVGAGALGLGTRHQPQGARSCELALRDLGAARGRTGVGRLSPGRGASGLGGSPMPNRPSLGRAAGARYLLAVGAEGAGVWTRGQPHSVRSCELALRAVRAAWGRLGGGASLAWVWGVGGWVLTQAYRPSFGLAAGARYALAVVAGSAGLGTRHQPQGPRSCELALPAVGAARGRPGGGASRLMWGLRGCALPHARPPVLGACGWGPLPSGCGCGVRVWGPGCPWHFLPCRGSSCVVRAFRLCGTRRPLLLGTCLCAVAVAGGVPLWRASWSRVGAPRLVPSGRSRCSGQLSHRCGAFLHPRSCRPRLYWTAAWGTWRPAKNRALCACRSPLPRQGRWACSASYPFGAPGWGCPWQVPPASVFGCVRCGGLACVDPVTDASGFPYRPFLTRDSAGAGAVSCGRQHLPFRVGGRHARVPRVCACACSSWPGRAGWPPGRVLVCLTFPLAVLSFFFVRPPPGWGCPCLEGFFFLLCPPSPLSRPRCLWLFVLPGLGCLGPWRSSFAPAPPDPPTPPAPPLFFSLLWSCVSCPLAPCAPAVTGCGIVLFPALGAPGLGVARSPPPPAPPPFFFPFSPALPGPLCGFFFPRAPLSGPFCCFRPWVPWASALCGCLRRPPSLSLSLFFFLAFPLLPCSCRSWCSWLLHLLAGFLFLLRVWPCIWCVRCVLGLCPPAPPSGGWSCLAVSCVLLCGAAVCCGLVCGVCVVLRCFLVPYGAGVVLCGVLSCCVVGRVAGGLPWALLPSFWLVS